jgi:dethiobiotin synthetase
MNKKNQTWFITGTDTGIGKTWCSLAFIKQLKQQGLQVAGMKPIASGCENGKNSDAEQILAASSLALPYEIVNPYAFEPAIAPHIAAQQVGQTIELKVLIEKYKQLAALADAVVIEGAGGWRVPINASQSLKDMVLAIDAKVILVVGLRLGCINHALLTAEAIQRDGCTLAAWIANPIDPEFDSKASIETISSYLGKPLNLISQ